MLDQEGIKANYIKKLFLFVNLCYAGITLYLIRDYVFPINILNPDFLSVFMMIYISIIFYAILNLITDLIFLSLLIKMLCYIGELLLLLNLLILGYFISISDQKNIDSILIDIKYIFAPMGWLSLSLIIWIDSIKILAQPQVIYFVEPIDFEQYPRRYKSFMISP